MPCVPCEKKKRLNQRSEATWKENHKFAKRVTRQAERGDMNDEVAEFILRPIMQAEQAFIDHSEAAMEVALTRLAAS